MVLTKRAMPDHGFPAPVIRPDGIAVDCPKWLHVLASNEADSG